GAVKVGRPIPCGRRAECYVNGDLSSRRYFPRGTSPPPGMSQIPRLCRHHPPPRTHCWAWLSIGSVVGGDDIVEAHPVRMQAATAIPTASRTMVTSFRPCRSAILEEGRALAATPDQAQPTRSD